MHSKKHHARIDLFVQFNHSVQIIQSNGDYLIRVWFVSWFAKWLSYVRLFIVIWPLTWPSLELRCDRITSPSNFWKRLVLTVFDSSGVCTFHQLSNEKAFKAYYAQRVSWGESNKVTKVESIPFDLHKSCHVTWDETDRLTSNAAQNKPVCLFLTADQRCLN